MARSFLSVLSVCVLSLVAASACLPVDDTSSTRDRRDRSDDRGDGSGEGEGEGEGGSEGEGEGEGEGEAPAGAPVLTNLLVVTDHLTPGLDVVVRIDGDDPEGRETLTDFAIVDAAGERLALMQQQDEDTWLGTVTWQAYTSLGVVDFAEGFTQQWRVRFEDEDGHRTLSSSFAVEISCGDTRSACDGVCGELRCGDVCAAPYEATNGRSVALCNGVCTDLTEPEHCGRCDERCNDGGSCVDLGNTFGPGPDLRFSCVGGDDGAVFEGCGVFNCLDDEDICLGGECISTNGFSLSSARLVGDTLIGLATVSVDGREQTICSGVNEAAATSLCRGLGYTQGAVTGGASTTSEGLAAQCAEQDVLSECWFADTSCSTAVEVTCTTPSLCLNDVERRSGTITRSGTFAGASDNASWCGFDENEGPDVKFLWMPQGSRYDVLLTTDVVHANVHLLRSGCYTETAYVSEDVSPCGFFEDTADYEATVVPGEVLKVIVDSPAGTTSGTWTLTLRPL